MPSTTDFLSSTTSTSGSIVIDSSAAATVETLPAATGSGDILYFVNGDVTNSASLVPASGESLNGAVDATFLFSNYAAGTQFRADDMATGEWAVSVVGQSGFTPRSEVAIPATELTLVSGATTLLYNTDPVDGQVAAYDGYYYDEGSTRHVYLPIRSDEDDLTTLEVSSNVIPPGASIESVQAWTDELGGGATTEDWNVGLANGTANQFFLNRIDTGGDQRNWTVHLQVKGATSGQVVLAGMVKPEALDRLHKTRTSRLDNSSFNDAALQSVFPDTVLASSTGAITDNGDGSFTLAAGHAFELEAKILMQTDANGLFVGRYQWEDVSSSGTMLGSQGVSQIQENYFGGLDSPAIFNTGVLPADLTVHLQSAGVTNGGLFDSYEQGSYLVISELPASTVVMPDALVPTQLSSGILNIATQADVTFTPAGVELPFDSAQALNGMTRSGAGLTVPNTGRYHLSLYLNLNSVNTAVTLQVVVDGVLAHSEPTQIETSAPNYISFDHELDLTAGQTVTIRMTATADAIFFRVGSQFRLAQLPDYSVVAWEPDQVEAKALSDGFVELSVNTNFTAAYSDVLTLDLPEAGRYRVHAKVSAVFDTSAPPNTARLFNVTSGAEISGSEITLGGTDVLTGNWQGTHSTERVITVTGPTTVSLQARGATGGANVMYASTDGNTSLGFERLPTTEVVQPGSVVPEDADFLATADDLEEVTFEGFTFRTSNVGAQEFQWKSEAGTGNKILTNVRTSYRNGTAGSVAEYDRTLTDTGFSQIWSDGSLNLSVSGAIQTLLWEYAGTTYKATFTLGAGFAGNLFYVEKIGSSKTIIPLGSTEVDDQTTSQFFDMGGKREQWIRNVAIDGTTPTTVTLPAPMADDQYVVLAQSLSSGGAYTFSPDARSATSFSGLSRGGNNAGVPSNFDFFIVGAKP